MKLTIPMTPPSVNTVWRRKRGGGYYIHPDAKAFYDAVAVLARGEKVIAKHYEVHAHIFLAEGQKGDVDNFGKCLLDAISKAGIIPSDAKVYFLALRKSRDPENPRTEVEVKGLTARP